MSTHGILRNSNSGVEIPGTLIDDSQSGLQVRVDGSTWDNNFRKGDGWTFTPDKPAIPTRPGLYGFKEGTTLAETTRLLLTTQGKWFVLDFTSGAIRTPEDIEDLFERCPDIHFVYGDEE